MGLESEVRSGGTWGVGREAASPANYGGYQKASWTPQAGFGATPLLQTHFGTF